MSIWSNSLKMYLNRKKNRPWRKISYLSQNNTIVESVSLDKYFFPEADIFVLCSNDIVKKKTNKQTNTTNKQTNKTKTKTKTKQNKKNQKKTTTKKQTNKNYCSMLTKFSVHEFQLKMWPRMLYLFKITKTWIASEHLASVNILKVTSISSMLPYWYTVVTWTINFFVIFSSNADCWKSSKKIVTLDPFTKIPVTIIWDRTTLIRRRVDVMLDSPCKKKKKKKSRGEHEIFENWANF